MRFFLISICLFVFSCASYPIKNNFKNSENISDIYNPYFADPHQDYIYKASIEVYNHTFSGIFIIKKIGTKQHRVAFTTEVGNKLFDFIFNKETFEVNYILDNLNKKVLINILKKDFKVLITEKLLTTETFFLNKETIKKASLGNKTYYYFESPELSKIIRASAKKEKARFLFTKISDNIAHQIQIIHTNIKLKINLKSIIK